MTARPHPARPMAMHDTRQLQRQERADRRAGVFAVAMLVVAVAAIAANAGALS